MARDMPKGEIAARLAHSHRGERLVRIRIYGIIGFSGFYHLVFDRQALIRIRLGGIRGYGENRRLDEVKS